jgi:hypothetical protein
VDHQAVPLVAPLPGQADSASISYDGWYFGQIALIGWEDPTQPSTPATTKQANAAFCQRYGGCPKPPKPVDLKMAQDAAHLFCLNLALDQNNGMGTVNPTLPSNPDSLNPPPAPTVEFRSQRLNQVPFQSQYEGEAPLVGPSPDMMILPPAVFVNATYQQCTAASGFTTPN